MWALLLLACAPASPPATDLGPRVIAEPRLAVCPDASPGPLRVEVRTTDASGQPLAGARIARQDVPDGGWTEVGRTGADGALAVSLEAAARLAVMGIPVDPTDGCPAAATASDADLGAPASAAPAPEGDPAADPAADPDGAPPPDAATAPDLGAPDLGAPDLGAPASAAPGAPAPLVFRATEPVCAVAVEVVDAAGAPVPGARVGYTWPGGETAFRTAVDAGLTDAAGRAEALPVPCAVQLVSATAADGRVGAVDVASLGGGEALRVVVAEPTAWLAGTVRSTAGAPVAGAQVWVTGRAILAPVDGARAAAARYGTRVRTDAAGAYRVALTPDPEPGEAEELLHVEVLADGFGESGLSVGLAPGAQAERDLEVDAHPRVHVRCAGRPGDSCADLSQVTCASHARTVEEDEEVVVDDVVHLAVRCPTGRDRRVRLGPVEVAVAADENVAWLDFRGFTGGVRGRIVSPRDESGLAAAPCFPTLVPTAKGGLLARDRTVSVVMETGPDGSFAAEHLPPGRYTFDPGCVAGAGGGTEIVIDDEVVDLGAG